MNLQTFQDYIRNPQPSNAHSGDRKALPGRREIESLMSRRSPLVSVPSGRDVQHTDCADCFVLVQLHFLPSFLDLQYQLDF